MNPTMDKMTTSDEAAAEDLASAVQIYHAKEIGKDVADWADNKVQQYGADCIAHARFVN